jgi:hypothetical protein
VPLNNKGIIAYGTDEDRQKLALMAKLSGQSGSEWIVAQIRKQYKDAFGDTAPDRIIDRL